MPSASERRRARHATSAKASGTRPRPPAQPSRTRATALMVAAAVALLTFAAFSGALDNGFVDWDDQDYVEQNRLVLGQQYGELLRAVVSNHFHPVTMLSLAWNVTTPLDPRPFITTSVMIHVVNTLLVFWLAFRLSARRIAVAGLVALLFGIHPLHVESVAWISERKDVLYAGFFLAAALAYLGYLERRVPWLLGLSFGLFVLACLSKEMAAAFPLVMVMLDYWKGRSWREGRAWLEKLPFLGVGLLSGLIVLDLQSGGDFHGLLRVIGPHEVVLGAPPGLTAFERLTLPTYGYTMYLWRMLVPLDLCAFYPFPDATTARSLPFLIAPFVFLGTMALAVLDLRRTRVIAFGIGWFFVTVALVLRWIPAGLVIMGDRYAYIASIGPFFMLAMGLQAMIERRPALRPALWGAAAAFAVWMFAVTLAQVETWRDSEALWTRVIREQPRVGSAYLYRGKHRFETGRMAEASDDFRSAYSLGVRSGEVYGSLGIAYGAEGRLDSALVMLDEAVRLLPERPALYHNRAITLVGLDRPREALADLDRALGLDPPSTAGILGTRGFAQLRLGDPRAAMTDFDRAIAAGALDDATWFGRSTARLQLGDIDGAAADLREILRRNPGNTGAQERLKALGR